MKYSLLLLFVLAAALAVATRAGMARHLVALVVGCFVLYVGALLPGAIGLFDEWPVVVTTSLISLSAILIAFRLPAHTAPIREPVEFWLPSSISAATIGVLLVLPPTDFLDHLSKTIPCLFDENRCALSWDAVSYHVPGLVEFAQNRTLWSFDGPYQSYSFGFELITSSPLLLFRRLFGIILGNLLAIALLISSLAALTSSLLERGTRSSVVLLATVVCVVLGWVHIGSSVRELGKNDVFAASAILGALSFVLAGIRAAKAGDDDRSAVSIALSGISLALAIGTKPNMLGFLPVWAVSVAYLASLSGGPLAVLWRAVPVTVLALVASGFFIIRNLVVYGKVTGYVPFDPTLTILFFNLSGHVVEVLFSPDNRSRLLWLAAGAAIVAILIGTKRGCRGFWGIVAVWLASSIAIFGFTPWSLYGGEHVQWRLGAFPFLLVTALVAAGATWIIEVAARHLGWSARPTLRFRMPRFLPLTVGAATCFILAFGPALSSRARLIGLPGFEQAHAMPTSVYRWVQSQGSGLRIYAAGLRPLGLYGPALDNRVFYDLHSSMFYEDVDYGRRRLESIRQDFDPDLIILAVDPHGYSSRRDKPLADWLRTQPCVTEVFSDAVTSVFRRMDGCTQPWNGSVRLPSPLRMGG